MGVLSSYNFFVNIKTYGHRCRGTQISHVALVVKNLAVSTGNIRDEGSIPELGRSPGKRAWQSTPVFLLESLMDRVAWWWATVHRVAKESNMTEAT